MSISDPAQCRDHSEDWLVYFHRRRGTEILELIDDQLIEEHAMVWHGVELGGGHGRGLR